MNNEAVKIETQEVAIIPSDVSALAIQAALAGDLSKLDPEQRLKFYGALCHSEGLNPLTKPFDWLTFQGKLQLYANKVCAEQKRTVHRVSVRIVERTFEHGCHIVRVQGRTADGREDEAIGAVPLHDKATGDAVANAMMKAETKAKRRVTFSLCGLSKFVLRDHPEEIANGAKTRIGEVQVETSADRATMLQSLVNAPIDIAEAEPRRTVSEPPVTPAITPEHSPALPEPPTAPPTTALPVETTNPQPSVPPSSLPATSALTADTVTKLEKVLGTNKRCIDFLIDRGYLQKGAGLATISKEMAEKITGYPTSFQRSVTAWEKSQASPPLPV